MHPILKCCGYYCSCLAAVSILFYGILLGLVNSENPYLVGAQSEHEIEEKMSALWIAMIVNGVCFGLCVVCLLVGAVQERVEEKKRLVEEESGTYLHTINTGIQRK